MYSYYEKALLNKKGAKNVVYVYPGVGYSLQKIVTTETEISIEELAYICIKSGKGMFVTDDTECEYDDRYVFCDMSMFSMDNGYLLIDNIRTEGVTIVC